MGPDSTARGFPWEGGAYQQGGERRLRREAKLPVKENDCLTKSWLDRRQRNSNAYMYIWIWKHFAQSCENVMPEILYYWCVHSDEMKITCNQQTDRILQKNIVSQTYAACSPRAIMCFDRSWSFFFSFSCFSLIFAFESWFRFCAKHSQKLL